jgi:hypothetical protein
VDIVDAQNALLNEEAQNQVLQGSPPTGGDIPDLPQVQSPANSPVDDSGDSSSGVFPAPVNEQGQPEQDESSIPPEILHKFLAEQAYKEEQHKEEDFYKNLAFDIPEQELSIIGGNLKHLIDADVRSQRKFFDYVAEMIGQLGLSIDEDGDVAAQGVDKSSGVFSSSMFEAILDILATAKTNVFPSTNMVDTVVFGTASDTLQDIAMRKKEFFNYYFDHIDREFRKEALKTLFWATLTGSCYKKVYNCPILGRPVSHFIPIQDFIVNRQHSSHTAATRKTHIIHLDARGYKARVKDGIYRDITIPETDETDEESPIKRALDDISGYEKAFGNTNLSCDIYECHVEYKIESDKLYHESDVTLPYIISLAKETGRVLSVKRNWAPRDNKKKKIEYFVNYSFLPSLDGEGYGMIHYAGKLSQAATAITRQLINSGTYSNFPGGVYQSGIRMESNNLRPDPGEFVPIETGGVPIRDCIQPLPYNEPSQALATLKDQLEDNIKKPSALVNEKVSDLAPRAPQGSVLAILENLQKVQNSVMQSFHESFNDELNLFNKRFFEWFSPEEHYPFTVPGGEHVVTKMDFEDDVQVIPSSDPARKNSLYRFMTSEIVIDQAKQFPDFHNIRNVLSHLYKNMGLPEEDIERILVPDQEEKQEEVHPKDPVSTIMDLTMGLPVTAAVWQDHAAYIAIINSWMVNNQENPNLQQAVALRAQHEAMQYMVEAYASLGAPIPTDPSQLPQELQNAIAVALAEKAMEAAQNQEQPAQPLDPALVELEAAKLERESAIEKHEIELAALQLKHEERERELTLKEQDLELRVQIEASKQVNQEQKTQIDAFKAVK